jgi:hypothetical protein
MPSAVLSAAMRHPAQVARLLEPKPGWREGRGSVDHDAERWEDACIAVAGASQLAYAAFKLRYSNDPPDQRLLAHLLSISRQELAEGLKVTPESLVYLAILEERAPESQRTVAHRHLAANVARGYWRHHCERPYARLGQELDALNGDAWRVIRSRLGE